MQLLWRGGAARIEEEWSEGLNGQVEAEVDRSVLLLP